MSILFVQYLRPDGRRKNVSIARDPEVEDKAALIVAAGYRFEVEELTTGQASLTIHDPRTEEDVAIEVCENGIEVPKTVDKLVNDFIIPDGRPC